MLHICAIFPFCKFDPFVSSLSGIRLFHLICVYVYFSCRFQYILGAATSPAVKVNEETLTYLNQGQYTRVAKLFLFKCHSSV